MHLSQEKLAEKAGASTNYIAMIESGRYFPSLPMINRIASSLNIESLDLFDRSIFEYTNLEVLRKEILWNITNAVNDSFRKAEQFT